MIIKLNESYAKPYTGLFWYIDGEVIGLVKDVDKTADNETELQHHYQVWRKLCNDYKVNGHVVPYDYFPRGRVTISIMPSLYSNASGYFTKVEMDPCLDTPECREQIANYYNLYANNAWGEPIFITSLDHYACHNCKEARGL